MKDFETLRCQYLYKKINNERKGFMIFCIIGIVTMVLAFVNWVFWYVCIPCLILGYKKYKTYAHSLRIREHVEKSHFYEILMKDFSSYQEACGVLTQSLQNDCVYQLNTLYITKDWIIDFYQTEVEVIGMHHVIWVYGVVLSGTAYVKGILDDASEFVVRTGELQRVVNLIKQNQRHILVGYSHHIESLMKKDPQDFVRRIQSGQYPSHDGQWL